MRALAAIEERRTRMTEAKFAEIAVPVCMVIYFSAIFFTARAWSLFCEEPQKLNSDKQR
jgi:hypothetical protein